METCSVDHCPCPTLLLVIPSSYTLRKSDVKSVNGSSATPHCTSTSVTTGNGDLDADLTRCNAPNTTVLFDGNTPTLIGSKWARQLLTLRGDTILSFSFSGTPGYAGVERIELTMFNCPEWGISVQKIAFPEY